MGNTYEITKCPNPNCDHVFEADTVMVHRSANYVRAEKLLRGGMSIAAVREHFCQYCGEYEELPRTCDCPIAVEVREALKQ